MAHIEISDFSRKFEDDFDRDMTYIVDKANDAIVELAGKYRGQFDEIDRNFDSYRDAFVKVLVKIVDTAYFDLKHDIEDIMKDAPYASLVVIAGEVDGKRFGSDKADDFIDDELSGNPYLEGVQGGSGRSRRDIERRSLAGARSRNGSSRDRGSRDRGNSRHRRSSRRDDDYDDQPRRGRLAKRTEEPKANNRSRERVEEVVEVVQEQKPTKLVIGEVITTENFTPINDNPLAPVYLIGHEQVILTEDGYSVTDYAGTNQVDYEKHRIDRFFPDILGGKTAASELALIALREAERVKDQTISGFITNPDNTEEQMADPKMFQFLKTVTYTTMLTQHGLLFDPMEIRNLILDTHNGDVNWFSKCALHTNIVQSVEVKNASNDVISRLTNLWASKQMHLFIQGLIELSSYMDIAAWRFIHDTITSRFNARLLRNSLNVTLDSITADWNAFKDLVATQYTHLAELQNSTNGILDGFEVSVYEDEETKQSQVSLNVLRPTLFIPVASFDLDIASPSIEFESGLIVKDSILFNAVKGHFATTEPGAYMYVVTTDNQILEIADSSNMLNPQQYVLRKI